MGVVAVVDEQGALGFALMQQMGSGIDTESGRGVTLSEETLVVEMLGVGQSGGYLCVELVVGGYAVVAEN